MKIAVDGRGAILYRGTGIGTYTWQLLDHLSIIDKDIRVFWPGEEYRDFSLRDPHALLAVERSGDYWRQHFLPAVIAKEEIALYHVPQNGLGLPGGNKVCRYVVTIHDLIPYLYPETVGKGYLREFMGAMPEIMEKSDHIIAVSQWTKNDIARIFGYPDEQITVIHEAPEPIYRVLDREVVGAFLAEKYSIDDPYIFYAGGFGMRKNVKALLNAFHLLCRESDLRHKLVIAGRRHREFDQSDALIEALNLEGRVILPDYVPVEDMPYFYGGGALMVYPSFYEGFGLPPLEAMACGCPVLASLASSLPEVLGDAVIYCDPMDTVAIAEKIHHILTDAPLRSRLREKGLAKAARYSWQKTAEETYHLYKTVLE